jgi:hypothetical protein
VLGEYFLGYKSFDETALLDLKDAEVLSLCLKLNLVTEQGYFYLDQCRDIRNNFSAAHPSVGPLDDHEVINFINRYVLNMPYLQRPAQKELMSRNLS